jgi:hypothetical protein
MTATRFRYSLTENKRALVKFLYSVNWDDETEVSIAPWCWAGTVASVVVSL